MARQRRDSDKERFWRDVLARHAASGLSVRAFCRRDGLSEASFHSWRRTIRRRDESVASKQPPAFVPAVVTEQVSPDAITIHLAGGRMLRVPESMPAERLVELVVALEARTTG